MITFNLAHAFEVYGGKNPDAKIVHAYLKKVGLKLPVNVIAIELENHNSASLSFDSPNLNTWVDASDKGMLYITWNCQKFYEKQ